MAIDKVKEYFKPFNMEDEIIELDKSSATVALAAEALGCMTNEIAKSLAFIVNEVPILVLTSGDVKIDNSKFKNTFETRARMIKPDEVEKLIGHDIGGVCPFGINDNVKVYLDESLKKLKYAYPACGSSNSAIKLTVDQLEKFSSYQKWVDVSK
ncbi:MAG: YbaK/EbsC family protein [Bacilli bacterium]|nr:YbaK/EbsC family protein [Bacilli bacterium]